MRSIVIAAAAAAAAVLAGTATGQPTPSSEPAKKKADTKTPAKKVKSPPEAHRKSVEELLRTSKDPLRRESAALLLGIRGSAAALPLLRQALAKDENKWVRTRAAEALGLIGDTTALPWLHNALSAEKEPRVRRTIAQALLRLGQSAGIKELVWQLKSGKDTTKAEVMLFLVGMTGQPLGQDTEAWWDYFNERGGGLGMARRPTGSPAVLPLRGVAKNAKTVPGGPSLYSSRPFVWRQVPAVVLELGPRREPVSRAALEEYEQKRGRIPDRCLLLVRTDWRDAKPRTAPPKKVGDTKAPRPMRPEPAIPWLEPDAVAFLLMRAPSLIGVGMDTPSLEPAPQTARPARDALLAAGRIALESVGDLDRLVSSGTRLILFPQARAPAVTVLALLP